MDSRAGRAIWPRAARRASSRCDERGQFLLDYIDLLLHERRATRPKGFRHVAPGQPASRAAPDPARGRERWVINKLRALNSWYTKGLDNGSHLRIAINAAESIPQLREIIEEFFFEVTAAIVRDRRRPISPAPTGRSRSASS